MEQEDWKPFRNFPLSAVNIFRKDRKALEKINAKAMSGAIQFVRNSRLILPNTAEIFLIRLNHQNWEIIEFFRKKLLSRSA
jgi:hypothetical protein